MTAPTNQEFVSGTTITSQWLNGVNDAINNSTQNIPGSSARTLPDKLSDVVSVKDFGAVGDGVTDDTAAFQKAANAAIGNNINPGTYISIPAPELCVVKVPIGEYLLTSDINPQGKMIIWELDDGTVITDIDHLNGRVNRNGLRINALHSGILDSACSFSVNANRRDSLDKPPGILGISNPNQLSSYSDRDSVGLYCENKAPAPVETCIGASYTLTTLIPVTPVDVTKLRVGMVIDTAHSPNKYSGIITSWAEDGTSITVSAWYEVTGATGIAGTPPGTADAYINVFTKVWALHAQCELDANSHATKAAGFELGIRNSKFAPILGEATSSLSYLWGYDAVSFGPNNASIGFIARGNFLYGFNASGNIESGVVVNARNGVYPVTAFESTCNSAYQINCKPDGTNSIFAVRNVGTIDIGSVATAATGFIRLRSSALTTDYDSRILWSGGTSTIGQGDLRFTAANVISQGTLRPFTDNTYPLGAASFRWSIVYAATGTINTSDEREKVFFDIELAEIAVARELKSIIRKFKFKDAIAIKGEVARIHFGVGAQTVIATFAKHGLDATRYGMLCYDEWDEQPEVISEDGVVVQEYRAAGNRYGIRYDELLSFIISAL